MTLPPNRRAYADCYELFDRALASKKGVRKKCSSSQSAHYLRNRLNQARRLDADVNRRVYRDRPDHPLFGDSDYYKFAVIAQEIDGEWYVVLRRNIIETSDIEELEPWDSAAAAELDAIADWYEFLPAAWEAVAAGRLGLEEVKAIAFTFPDGQADFDPDWMARAATGHWPWEQGAAKPEIAKEDQMEDFDEI